MSAFRQFQRKQIAELRPYEPGESVEGVSISEADYIAGSPKLGDMIARNPKNHADQWLVAAQYFADNFEAMTSHTPQPTQDEVQRAIKQFGSPTIGRGDIHGGMSAVIIYEDQWGFITQELNKLFHATSTEPTMGEIEAALRYLRKTLSAIAEGYKTKGEDDRYIVVENPDGDAESMALRGADPNLCIDLDEAFKVFDRINFALSAANSVREQQPAGQGWQLVPKEPTRKMLDKACEANGDLGYLDAEDIWKAMLAASPVPQSGEAG